MRCIRPCLKGIRHLARAQDGLAAVEFGLILPVMVTMLAGLYDTSYAFIAWQRVNLAANAIDQIATTAAANAIATNTLTQAQAIAASTAAHAYLPGILTGAVSDFGVTISSVAMTPTVSGCTSNCTYTAHVAWSGTYAGTAGQQRSCDAQAGQSALTRVPDSSPASATTLPADVYSAAPLLVVDVKYTYRPVFYT
ncbi:MAG: pilus assembly protein, partial [Rhodospirillales bacterium]|nr:pilus assembly protein [Acetobacter sp.]